MNQSLCMFNLIFLIIHTMFLNNPVRLISGQCPADLSTYGCTLCLDTYK